MEWAMWGGDLNDAAVLWSSRLVSFQLCIVSCAKDQHLCVLRQLWVLLCVSTAVAGGQAMGMHTLAPHWVLHVLELKGDCPNTKPFCPSENSHTPLLEDSVTQMTPEEHYRRMMSALNEHGTFEEQQQQRLYQLANSMAVPSHGGRAWVCCGELRFCQMGCSQSAACGCGAMGCPLLMGFGMWGR